MRTLQIWHTLQSMEQLTEKITEVRKSSRVAAILVVCLISLPVLLVLQNSKIHLFEPVGNLKPLAQNAQNVSAHHLEKTVQNVTASVGDTGRQNNSSKPPTTSTMPIDHPPQLDELLASGFDKNSCISRLQAASYRKTRLHKPSSYLISKLRNYEELHARCGPHSVSYRRTMRKLKLLRSTHVDETIPCKYLVWTPANGLGNRMVSIASAFLYALLNNRVLLVEFEADMEGLFCEPFPNSSWLLPHNFPHKNQWSSLPSFKSRVNTGNSVISPPFLHLDLKHGEGDSNLRHFHCSDTQPFLEKIPAIILSSDQYFVPSLFMVSSFKEELNKMFPEKAAVFHHFGHYLFNPSNEAWGLITRFYQAYLSKADEKIGLQIRIFHSQQVPHKNIISQILSCTLKHNILPSLDKNKSLNVPFGNHTSTSKAILVTSLYAEYAEELRTMYWTRPTMTGDVIGVYQPSHEEHQKFKDNIHNMKAWAEIYLLSLCDVLVTSPQSTFGYVAQSLGGVKPWIMNNLGRKEAPDPPCKRGSSMEPCFHVAPKYDCKGKTKIHNVTALSPRLMSCEDVWWGVKLTDA